MPLEGGAYCERKIYEQLVGIASLQ